MVDLATMSFRQQLETMRRSNIYVGAHGAGLMHVMFLAEEAVLVEIHPHYRLDRHFRLAARMAGKVYLPMRTTTRVSCSGSSDSIPVEVPEFKRTMDAAVRLARCVCVCVCARACVRARVCARVCVLCSTQIQYLYGCRSEAPSSV